MKLKFLRLFSSSAHFVPWGARLKFEKWNTTRNTNKMEATSKSARLVCSPSICYVLAVLVFRAGWIKITYKKLSDRFCRWLARTMWSCNVPKLMFIITDTRLLRMWSTLLVCFHRHSFAKKNLKFKFSFLLQFQVPNAPLIESVRVHKSRPAVLTEQWQCGIEIMFLENLYALFTQTVLHARCWW